MARLAFIPVLAEEALALRDGGDIASRTACSPTESLVAVLEPDPTEPGAADEEAEFAALSYAGVLGLFQGSGPARLVLAADVQPSQLDDDDHNPYGVLVVSKLRWSQVRALFTDEREAAQAVLRARSALAEAGGATDLDGALALPAVGELMHGYDLLWFAPGELDQLVSALEQAQDGAHRAD
jgi:Family of unknown function (DUF6912)